MDILRYIKAAYRGLKFRQLLGRKKGVSAEAAETVLQKFLPRQKPVFTQHNAVEPVYDVMIIVPVYNVEAYLEQCINSVMNQQTNYTYQAVFVDDGSTDRSGEILDRMVPAPHIVAHSENRGVSTARNLAMRHLSGRYVMFLDSDDYLSPNTVDQLVSAADQYAADIVEGGYVDFNEQGIICRTSHGNGVNLLHSRELYGFPWGKVIRSDLLQDFSFPEGYRFEDTVMAALLHPKSNRSIAISDILYYYRDNSMGITHTSKGKSYSVDTFWMMKYCLEERLCRGQVLEQADYQRYLTAVRRNWIRTEGLPEEIQESIFALTCDLFAKSLHFRYDGQENRMALLELAIRKQSYDSYRFLMERWEIM